ncbi:MAG: hypothetical protein OXH70_13995 [Acidobacteria bacterium]|nr:hypothetical protein [Acidobacteriota bacterium]
MQQSRTDGPYIVSVDEVRLGNLGGDHGSGPDVFVQIRRHNPEIDKTLDQLNKEVSSLSAESSTASADLSRLKDKDAASRIVPGESLSREESGRLRGNGWVTLTRSVLDDGELRVRMEPHVDDVELRFRPALPQDE